MNTTTQMRTAMKLASEARSQGSRRKRLNESKPATPPAAAPASATPPPAPAVAPQPKVDPMKVGLSDLSPEQEREIRDALLLRLQEQFTGMSACLIREVSRYADIQMADGYDPAGDFIESLVMKHHLRSLTPDDVAFRLEEFRENFKSAAKDARIFTARYPEAVKPATTA